MLREMFRAKKEESGINDFVVGGGNAANNILGKINAYDDQLLIDKKSPTNGVPDIEPLLHKSESHNFISTEAYATGPNAKRDKATAH
jgi:hypothetical protein